MLKLGSHVGSVSTALAAPCMVTLCREGGEGERGADAGLGEVRGLRTSLAAIARAAATAPRWCPSVLRLATKPRASLPNTSSRSMRPCWHAITCARRRRRGTDSLSAGGPNPSNRSDPKQNPQSVQRTQNVQKQIP